MLRLEASMTTQTLASLQQDFQVEGARWQAGSGGLPVLTIQTEQCEAQIYAYGAHLTSWAPAGQRNAIFVTGKSAFTRGKAIRGGIPVCWPWFGARRNDPKPDGVASPAHGIARTRDWVVEAVRLEDNGRVHVEMVLDTATLDEDAQALWEPPLQARLVASFGLTLSVSLETRNTGTESVDVEGALHTYLAVDDVTKVRLHGLAGTAFYDKANDKDGALGADPLVLVDEFDRLFLGTKQPVVVEDPGFGRRLRVEKAGSNNTVVWNPGLVKGTTMPDVGGDDWRRFVCVEAANVGAAAVPLSPGAVHTLQQRIRVEPL
jgi:glucose-6-phosphate 1-epimerase